METRNHCVHLFTSIFTDVKGTFGFMLTFLLLQPAVTVNLPIDNIKVENFKIKLGEDSLEVVLGRPSCTASETADLNEDASWPIKLGVRLKNHGVSLGNAMAPDTNKLVFGGHTSLELRNLDFGSNCVEVSWSTSENHTLEDCFQLSPHNWFGGPEDAKQYWPIQQHTFQESPYFTIHLIRGVNHSVCEPYWLNSDGFFVYVDHTVPLFIDQNHHKSDSLCLMAKNDAPYSREGGPTLMYTMCKFDNPRSAHEFAVKKFLGKPTGIPDTRMITHPIWSTWAEYKADIDEDIVKQYGKEIKDHGFNNSQLEIDDNWETCYGSLSFDKKRFPDMKRLTGELTKMGFRTTIWVHPFINENCELHKEAKDKGYLVKNIEGETTTVWWNGVAGYIDFTNPEAAGWYEKRIRNLLSESGIESLKFDAGESGWSPQVPIQNGPKSDHPELIIQKYVQLAARFGPMVEVKTGKRTQTLPVFVRMCDRESVWDLEKQGLRSVITTTFQMNMNGYPFVLPDMVGGNEYNGMKVTKEMFLRYLQVNVFLPAIQFSIPPWDYDSETVELSKKYTALRYRYADKIIEAMRNSVRTGQPVNPPIWWVDPTNKEAHEVNSEYMLGEDILVAPVVEEGATSRDIYLPKGHWQDEVSAS